MYGDVDFGDDAVTGPVRRTAEDASMDRVTIFGEVSYTLMVLNFVLSGGVQSAADGDDFGGVDFDPERAMFVSGSLRLSI